MLINISVKFQISLACLCLGLRATQVENSKCLLRQWQLLWQNWMNAQRNPRCTTSHADQHL
jgi:hypothetical protein